MTLILPEAFRSRIAAQMGREQQLFFQALEAPAPVSLRLNPQKVSPPHFDQAEMVPWCANGRYLPEKPVYTLDPFFHAGSYYPQEASSMVLDWILKQLDDRLPDDPVLLDLCGAPGGKSTLMSAFLAGRGLLVSNEVIKSRANVLAENMAKWGEVNQVVTRSDPSAFSALEGLFDLMVVDAPCSGEGMFRKDVRAIEEWSSDNARHCALRQQRILSAAWPALKQGGYLIYSTCTFNPEENEAHLRWLAAEYGAEILPLRVPGDWGTVALPVDQGNGLAFYPHKVKGEGFFVALLRKTSGVSAFSAPKAEKKKDRKAAVPAELNRLLVSGAWHFEEAQEGWRAFPAEQQGLLQLLQRHVDVLSYGVLLGQALKAHWVPAAELALSTSLHPGAFPGYELDLSAALRYLKGEALEAPQDLLRGYVLLSYAGAALGFGKNIGRRINNLFPAPWRIRMSLPQ